ncbi:hypothetical protein MKZ38_006842 [Zalerion maritima]|uniref:Succinate-semialdehyde dehydrogenase, mitochondrial n=1 Tax=Zalerion maritima TaxID=339359 RepID=A0AAD5RIH1_9PEZI|nr:hypothetical protein MKZ38_006842 [Zalerion maritima]
MSSKMMRPTSPGLPGSSHPPDKNSIPLAEMGQGACPAMDMAGDPGNKCRLLSKAPKPDVSLHRPTPDQLGRDAFPALSFLPIVLRQEFLWSIGICLHVIILILIIVTTRKGTFQISSDWLHFSVQILPLAFGTISAEVLISIFLNISRIGPYMKCHRAYESHVHGGGKRYVALMGGTLLRNFFPYLGFRDALQSKDLVPLVSWVMIWTAPGVLALKASFLSIDRFTNEAVSVPWVGYSLISIYSVIICYIIVILVHFNKHNTGLRWAPDSLADILVLLRYSDFMDTFVGSGIATRGSLFSKGSDREVQLGYWMVRTRDGDEFPWHGFALADGKDLLPPGGGESSTAPQPGATQNVLCGQSPTEEQPSADSISISEEDLSLVRHNTVYTLLRRRWAFGAIFVCTTLFSFFITVAALFWNKQFVEVDFGYNGVIAVFELVPTFLASALTWFWEDVALFYSATEPFSHMAETAATFGSPGENIIMQPNKENGGKLEDTLLLNYANRFRLATIHAAFLNRHWDTALVNSLAAIQRLLPIMVGSSVAVYPGNPVFIVISKATAMILVVWLMVYTIAIGYLLQSKKGGSRRLPRNFLSVGDIISWTCSSSLLRDSPGSGGGRTANGNHPYMWRCREHNPLDIPVGNHFTRCHMESQLLLSERRCAFGLFPAYGRSKPDEKALGIEWSGDTSMLEDWGHQGLFRRRQKTGRTAKAPTATPVVIAGAKNFELIRNVEDMTAGGPIAAMALANGLTLVNLPIAMNFNRCRRRDYKVQTRPNVGRLRAMPGIERLVQMTRFGNSDAGYPDVTQLQELRPGNAGITVPNPFDPARVRQPVRDWRLNLPNSPLICEQKLKTPTFLFAVDLKDGSLFISRAFIDGQWADKEKKFDVYEPATATVLGKVSDCNLDDFKKAIDSANVAQPKFFASTTGAQRGAMLRKWHDLMMANKDDLTKILSLENGKTYAEAAGEITYAASFISWFAEEATRSYGVTIPSQYPNTALMTFREPVGVCGIITPWNFPAAMITRKIAPALAAGCAVVIKPPSATPYSCLALAKLAVEAGLPPQVVQVCPTTDRQAATELCTSPVVKKISFTGSTGVGKTLAKLATGTLKKMSLELGGNAPFIVFNDADLDLAVEGAMFCKFRCSGQTCVCANRLYVQSGVSKAFTEKLVAKVSALRMGPGLEGSTTQGPLVNKGAVAKVEEHVSDATSKGAKVEFGGSAPKDLPGYFYTPTVLSGVTSKMQVSWDETFGPLAAVFTFETEEEVVKMANDTEFGLAGYFFSKDIGRVMRVAAALQVGMVGANTGKISASEAPFGGVKESGYGKEGSLFGLAEYQNIKSVTIGNLDG